MTEGADCLAMLVWRDEETGRWEPVWPAPVATLPTIGEPYPGCTVALVLPRSGGAQVGDRLIAEEEASELVHWCGPLEPAVRQFIRSVHDRFGCDETYGDRVDAIIVAHDVWITEPVQPGRGTERLPAAVDVRRR